MRSSSRAGTRGLSAGLDCWQVQPPWVGPGSSGWQLGAVAQSGSPQSTAPSPSSSTPLSQSSGVVWQAGSFAQSGSAQSMAPSPSSSAPLSQSSD
jgi:hypothetical protein